MLRSSLRVIMTAEMGSMGVVFGVQNYIFFLTLRFFFVFLHFNFDEDEDRIRCKADGAELHRFGGL